MMAWRTTNYLIDRGALRPGVLRLLGMGRRQPKSAIRTGHHVNRVLAAGGEEPAVRSRTWPMAK